MVLGAVFLVLALIFPMLFHLLRLGSAFLPMFLPLALAGMLLRPKVAVCIGIIAPLLSGLLTGMPPFYPPVAPQMMVEGAVLSGTIALLRMNFFWGIYPSLIAGLLAQRMVLALLVFVIAPLFHLPAEIFTVAKLISGIPGVLMQLVTIPPLVKLLEKRIQLLRVIT